MRYLVVAPGLGLTPSGESIPGGLFQFARCVTRALASAPAIDRLDVWSLVDVPEAEAAVRRMTAPWAHPRLGLGVRAFGGSRARLSGGVAAATLRRRYDRVMYLLVSQAVLAELPGHPPCDVWQVGREVFEPLTVWRKRALCRAGRLLSISRYTTDHARRETPGLTEGEVVHLCVEPPLTGPEDPEEAAAVPTYDPARRECAVLIVGNLYRTLLYKGHQALVAAWNQVTEACPEAQLWIAGQGDGRADVERFLGLLRPAAARNVTFLGRLDEAQLQERYRRCRVFAMPSTGEGFGLVFLEAARHGVPCIAGKHDAAAEIVLHGETGLLVEQHPHDLALACLQLLTDHRLARRLGEAGRRRLHERFRFTHFRQRVLRALGLATDAGAA